MTYQNRKVRSNSKTNKRTKKIIYRYSYKVKPFQLNYVRPMINKMFVIKRTLFEIMFFTVLNIPKSIIPFLCLTIKSPMYSREMNKIVYPIAMQNTFQTFPLVTIRCLVIKHTINGHSCKTSLIHGSIRRNADYLKTNTFKSLLNKFSAKKTWYEINIF